MSGDGVSSAELTLGGLRDKVAVVTGAGRMRGIGRSVAMLLARAGCDVVVTGSGRDPSSFPEDERAAGWRDVESVAGDIRALGRRATAVACDISDPQQVRGLADTVRAEHRRLDFLVNNAGAAKGEDRRCVLDVDAQVWRRVIEVNLVGTFQVSKELVPLIAESPDGGAIVNISSVAGKLMPPDVSAYAASKAGIDALTGCLAVELASRKIRVNAVAPGLIDTSRLDALGRDEGWASFVANVPMGRAGTGDDIAWMVAFLCSERASWITGQTYLVDGGAVRLH